MTRHLSESLLFTTPAVFAVGTEYQIIAQSTQTVLSCTFTDCAETFLTESAFSLYQ